MDQYLRLRELLKAFLTGGERSKAHVALIEGHLIEHLYEDEAFGDLLEASARYQPGGGEFLYGEESLAPLVTAALNEVERRLATNK